MTALSRLEVTVINIFWLGCLLNPTPSVLKLKLVVLLLILLVLGLRISISITTVRLSLAYVTAVSIVILMPMYGLIITLLRGGFSEEFIDTSYLTSLLYFFPSFLYLFSDNKRKAFDAMLFSLRAVSVLILLSFFALSSGYGLEIVYYFVSIETAFIGMREYGGISFHYIYYIVSPMLVILVAYDTYRFLWKRNFLSCFLLLTTILALFLTGTRANMLLSVLTPLVVFGWRYLGNLSFIFIGIAGVIGLSIAMSSSIPIIQDMFDPTDVSNEIKLSYLTTYQWILSDLDVLLFGQGFNAHAWDPLVLSMLPEGASKTELTYFEGVRVFGLLGFLPFLALLLYLVISVKARASEWRWMSPALFIYFIASALNPYIFSSNGMLIVGLALTLLVDRPKKVPSGSRILSRLASAS